jgi:hypothetical protein
VSPSKTITCTFERFGLGAGGFGGFSAAGADCVVARCASFSDEQPAASSASTTRRSASRRTRFRLETRAVDVSQSNCM